MKRRLFLALLILFLLVGLAGSIATPQNVTALGEPRMIKSVLASGGSSVEGGSVKIKSTIGQSVMGVAKASEETAFSSGFWTWMREIIEEFLNFLPVIFN